VIHIPKSCRISLVDDLPSKETNFQKTIADNQLFRTFHNCLHTTNKTVDHTQGLGPSDPSLFLRQSIQSLQNRLYLALPQQLLSKLLWGTLSDRKCIRVNALTEPTLLDLLCRQGKHRKYFNHYFDNDIRHYRSRWDRRIDLQALQEIPQALEEIN
jgi:hypothetical protein